MKTVSSSWDQQHEQFREKSQYFRQGKPLGPPKDLHLSSTAFTMLENTGVYHFLFGCGAHDLLHVEQRSSRGDFKLYKLG